jgi:adenylosuccinate lyase
MAAMFSDERRYELWRRVELAVVDAYAAEGLIDDAVAEAAHEAPAPSAGGVAVLEREVQHDVVAFLLAWTGPMSPAVSATIHRGLTSSDVVDTALALQVVDANSLLQEGVDALFTSLRSHALAHRRTPRVGRTHGQDATSEVWGHRVADLAFAAHRASRRLRAATQEMSVAKLSGPTGSYEHVPAAVEARAAATLGLRPVEVATQVVMRDRLAAWTCAVAVAASVCEAVALEVRLGAHSAVAELAEGVSGGQVGSSAMAHKRNPVTAERICGLARVVRSYVVPVMEGVALWHERDISHSSVERVCVPDAAALLEHMLSATVDMFEGLSVDVERMAVNLASSGSATRTHSALVVLADAGLGWAQAWRVVRAAVERVRNGDVASFYATVVAEAAKAGVNVSERTLAEAGSGGAGLDGVFDRLAALDV